MPFTTSNDARIYYRLEGSGDRPLLVLAHSLGADHGMWDPQVPALLGHFQVLRFDIRGHGASDAPPGDYSMEQLGGDALAVAGAAGRKPFAFCGLSLGGMIGQWLAANAAECVTRLVLANTSPKVAEPSLFEGRRRAVLEQGMTPISDAVMQRFFSARTLGRGLPIVASTRATLLSTNPAGYAGCCAAIRDMDHTALLGKIRIPTLVIAGDHDVSTPWTGHGEVLAQSIPGALARRLPTAHLSNLEKPSSFNTALLEFLLPRSGDTLAAGLAMRRAVLGDAHVDRAMAQATEFNREFNREFQETITRYAWGAIWTRPGLDPRTRRWLALATTAALGRWEEFRLHVRTGLASELEMTDLKEVLLQVAVYAGVPAANTGFHIATEESANAATIGNAL
jgi:3-oxoadipate enol-lactonase/4-carboxymuconolactone decarboxylase